jgi:hypothetical protein
MIYKQNMRRFIDRQLLLNIVFSLLIFCVVKFARLSQPVVSSCLPFWRLQVYWHLLSYNSPNLGAVLANYLRRLSDCFRIPDVGLRWVRQFA